MEQPTNYSAQKLTDVYNMLYKEIFKHNITVTGSISISNVLNEGKALLCWSGINPISNGKF